MPIIDAIHWDTLDIFPIITQPVKGIFEWGLLYKVAVLNVLFIIHAQETPLTDQDLNHLKYDTDPYDSPIGNAVDQFYLIILQNI